MSLPVYNAINGCLLALDGPCNGEWIDGRTAFANGYDLYTWPTSEIVWALFDPSVEPAEFAQPVPFDIEQVHITFIVDDRELVAA